ncbi:VCBS domain-containing protein [Geomonas subterranea]|uniref:VCBS domain-containing protein n=1 Tax=Geomonas subterranea TaxID=2847989 RepID=A0ABX8LKA5_9BACT|nr:VCBS domain-containing protein [Geomonas subterranea]QXE91064.1 VCBS domain-containing protein [Geomonas subterranea]QXM10850.1 VCBS domain-containing protein [Geomonas subterranea]
MAQNNQAAAAGAGNQVVGKVVILYGTVKAVSPDGAVRLLMPNSPIYANDHIVTESDGSVSIVFDGAQGNQLDLGRMMNVAIDHDVYGTVMSGDTTDTVAEVEQIQQALATGDQPIELEAPAAGGPADAGGTHPVFIVTPTGEEVLPTGGVTTTGVTFGTTGAIEGAVTVATTSPVPPAGPGVGSDHGSVTEDSSNPTLSTTGTLTVADTFGNQYSINTAVAPVASEGALGSISIDSAGHWTYSVNNAAVQYLGAGEPKIETFTVQAADGTSHEIVITITGTNDVPVIDAEHSIATGSVSEGDPAHGTGMAASGVVSFTDVDQGDLHTLTVTTGPAHGVATVDADGTWHYTVTDSGVVDALPEGQVLTDSFMVQVADNHGGTATQLVTLQITGTNDAPVIDVVKTVATGSVSEGDDGSLRTTSGVVSFTDVDQGDLHTLTVTTGPAHGVATVDADGTWHYTVTDSGVVDALPEGQVLTDSFMVQVADNHGGTATQLVTLQITGTNDAPVIDVVKTVATGSVSEGDDGSLRTTSGVVSFTDVDQGDLHTLTVTTGPAHGVATVDADGTWHYTVTDSGVVDALPEGQVLTDSFMVQVADNHGGTATQLVTLQITGTNDAPVIDVVKTVATGSVSEGDDGSLRTTSGVVSFTDVDQGDLHTLTVTTGPAHGVATVDADGTWHYTVTDSGVVDALPEGQVLTDSFMVQVADNHGGTATQLVTLQITGTNDAPVIDVVKTVATGSVSEGDDGSLRTTSGVVSFTDVDQGDLHTLTVTTGPAHGVATVDADGTWHYTVTDSGVVDALPEGQVLTDSFMVQVADNHGGTATQLVTLQITGTNDAPVIDVVKTVATGSVSEGDDGSLRTTSGVVSFTDVDQGDLHTLTVTTGPAHGVATVDADGTWHYTVTDSGVVDALPEGQVLTDSFMVQVADNHGGTATQLVTLQITGTNDAPVIDVVKTVATGSVSEGDDGSLRTTSGVVSFTDVDQGDLHTLTVTTGPAHGVATVDADGTWHYTVTDSGVVDALPEGQVLTDSFMVQVADNHGGTATQLVTLQITGTNDAPVIDVVKTVATGSVSEGDDGSLRTTSGVVSFTDVDQGDLHTLTVTTGPAHGVATVDADGTWHYTVTDSGVVDALPEGQVLTDSFMVQVADNHGGTATQLVTLQITGTNDAPVIDVVKTVATGSVSEGDDGSLRTTSGVVSFTDVDQGDLHTLTVTTGPAHGVATVDADGTWHYTVTDSGVVDALPEGQVLTDSFMVQVADNHGGTATQLVTLQITGTNDAPVIDVVKTVATGSVSEGDDGSLRTTSGVVSFTDVDQGDLHTLTVTTGPAHGVATVDADGTWHYTVTDSGVVDALPEGQVLTDSFMVQVADNHGGTATQLVTLQITGTNDAPVIDVVKTVATGSVSEGDDGSLRTTSGVVSFTDVDQGDLHTLTVTTGPAHGVATVDADGTWHYTVTDSGVVDALPEGQVLTDSFMVQVADNHGGTATQLVTLQITGTNDAPVIDVVKTVATGSVSEGDDGSLRTTSGVVSFTDVDQGDLHTLTVTTGPAHGVATVDADGTWHYTVTDSGVVDALPEGQVLTDSFMVQVADNHGGTATQLVTLQITGTNDAPVIDVVKTVATGSVSEGDDGSLRTTSGVVSFTDVDQGDLHTLTVTTGPAHGVATVDADGTWHYTVTDSGVVDALPEGQVLTDSFMVQVADNHGGTATQLVTLQITGTNDAPVIDVVKTVATGSVSEGDDGSLRTTSGVVSFTDVDQGDLHTLTVTTGPAHGVATVDADGTWHYTVTDSGVVDALPEGQVLTDSFMVQVADNHGGTATQLVTLQITGTNDAPVIDVVKTVATGSVSEGDDGSLRTTSGVVSFTDVDQGDLHTLTVTTGPAHGVATVDADGTWHYTVTDSGVVDALPEGQVLTDSFMVQVADNHGGTATQLVTLQITGTNDAPVIDVVKTVATGSVSEGDDGSLRTTSGVVSFTDVDQGDLHTLTVTTGPAHGVATVDADGTWHYTVTDSGVVDALPEGQVLTDSFMVQVADNHGGTATQLVTLQITGTNDAPVIDVVKTVATGSVSEGDDGSLRTTSGVVSFTDVDQGDLHTLTVTTGPAHGVATVDADGTWHYTVTDSGVVDALPEGQVLTDSFMVQVADNHGGTATQLVTLQITGTNDAPVIDVVKTVATGSVSEGDDGSLRTTSGVVSFTDVDQGDLHTLTVTTGPAHGVATVDADGTWHYTVTDSGVVDALPEGQVLTDSFMVQVADNHGGTATQMVTLEIIGTNDKPEIGGVFTGTVTEDNGAAGVLPINLTASGDLTIHDVDQGQSSFIPQGSFVGTYGTFTLDANGHWTYTADNTQAAIQQLGLSGQLTDSFTAVSYDGTANQVVTVTINGTPEFPTVDSHSVYMPDASAEMTGDYANGYALQISAPTDAASITVGNVPTVGTVGYMDGGTFHTVHGGDVITSSQLQSLLYKPDGVATFDPATGFGVTGADNVNFTYTVNNGFGSSDGTIDLHTMLGTGGYIAEVQVGSASHPLTSGSNQAVQFAVDPVLASATDYSQSAIQLTTDFRDMNTKTLTSQVETQVNVKLIIDGHTFTVVSATDPAVNWEKIAGSGGSTDYNVDHGAYWTSVNTHAPADANTIEKHSISFNDISDGTSTLADYLTAHPQTPGSLWTVVYDDIKSGNEQARFIHLSIVQDVGAQNAVTINGSSGNDVMYGTTSDGDIINGGAGNDTIVGREGNDVLSGGTGHNTFTGGAGADTFKVSGNDTIKDFTANEDKIVIDQPHTDVLFEHTAGSTTASLTVTNNGTQVGTVTFENVTDATALLNSLIHDDPKIH